MIALLATSGLLFVNPVQANETIPDSFTQEMVRDVDLFTEEQMAEWNVEAPKPIEADSKEYTRAPLGSWSTRPGIIVVRDGKVSGIISVGHAGIMGAGNRHTYIIEANLLDGVQAKRKRWDDANQVWQLNVKNTSAEQDSAAAKWAMAQIGKYYNTNFNDIWNRERFYCSQLVWAAYRDTSGSGADLSSSLYGVAIHPYELRDHPNTLVIYRKK
ncbi:hypothetical protein HO404_03070 [Streptococcus suis]|uniref:Uncharacterized protein YycO n=2 Tax=Streptococcus parasuis TaxID=1501662 RepID=A0ABV2ETK5_9STRE|nr:YiiX/YebB-like N1pC/P60 family cysteine hydrolase [Streptococcus parasuis]NQM54812.1 hypothetical protein [Streptococcus suis]HEL1557479.1 hypothetical protein [Streptococcus suis]